MPIRTRTREVLTATATTVRRKKRVAVPDAYPPLTAAERERLWTLIVDCLYQSPRPPFGWDRQRDGSILKQLARHYAADTIAAAIQGVRLVFKTDTPLTLKSIYAAGTGVRPLFGLAVDAFHKSQDRAAPKAIASKPRPPQPLSSLIAKVMPNA